MPTHDAVPLWRCTSCPIIIPGNNRSDDIAAHRTEHNEGQADAYE